MNEVWMPVVGHEGVYEVSSMGNIKSIDRKTMGRWGSTKTSPGKLLKPYIGNAGYKRVSLSKGGSSKQYSIHRIVAESFLEKSGEVVNHINGDKLDNRVENLEWCTRSQNTQHALNNGLMHPVFGEAHSRAKLNIDQVREIRSRYVKGKVGCLRLAKEYGLTKATVQSLIAGKTWKAKALLETNNPTKE